MSRSGAIKAGLEALQGANKASREAELLSDAAGLSHDKAIISAVEAAGLSSAAEDVSDRARQIEVALNKFDKVEQAIKAPIDELPTTLSLLRHVTKPSPYRELLSLWRQFSPREKMKLFIEMVRRADQGLAVIHPLVAGAVREMAAKHLKEIKRIVDDEKLRIRAMGSREDNLSFIDTGTMGDVFLPTKILRTKGRSIELGTDRIIGIGRGNPQTMTFPAASGENMTLMVHGELEITVAIEVKGRTTITGGQKQVEALFGQGRGTQGYAIINGNFWLLKYDPLKVHHVVVAARGDDFDLVSGVMTLSSGGKLTVVEIPIKLDNQIQGASRVVIDQVGVDLMKRTKKALNKGKPSKTKRKSP